VAIPLELPVLPYEALRHLLFAEAAAAFEELTLEDIDDTLARQDPGAWPNSFRKEIDGATHTVPRAITFVAPLFDDVGALTLGQAMEAALGVAHRRPKLI
jgi:hypothetical protein